MTQGAIPLDRVAEPVAADLIDLAAHGDPGAFDTIARMVGDGLYWRALAILRDEPDAGDATQETLIRAWRELPRLGSQARFGAWLDRILVNVCRDQLRHRGRQQVREIHPVVDAGSNEWLGIPEKEPHAGDDRSNEIAASFRRLSVEDRTLLVLHHLERRSVADLASVLAIPSGTVMRRLHTARGCLQRALEQESR